VVVVRASATIRALRWLAQTQRNNVAVRDDYLFGRGSS
jgi:hypothetical protein